MAFRKLYSCALFLNIPGEILFIRQIAFYKKPKQSIYLNSGFSR